LQNLLINAVLNADKFPKGSEEQLLSHVIAKFKRRPIVSFQINSYSLLHLGWSRENCRSAGAISKIYGKLQSEEATILESRGAQVSPVDTERY
jgi:hypothetical protein